MPETVSEPSLSSIRCLYRAHISFNAGFMHYFIDIIRCDARLQLTCSNIEHFSGDFADFPHAILRLPIQNLYGILTDELVFRISILRVIWVWYRFWNGSFGGQRVDRA